MIRQILWICTESGLGNDGHACPDVVTLKPYHGTEVAARLGLSRWR